MDDAKDGRRYFKEIREMGTRRVVVVVVVVVVVASLFVDLLLGGDTERCFRRSSMDFFE